MTSGKVATQVAEPESWRRLGVPESDASPSLAYLQKLQAEFRDRVSTSSTPLLQRSPKPVWVVEHVEGFDCRSGERPRKKRAQAEPLAEELPKGADELQQQATGLQENAAAAKAGPEAQPSDLVARKSSPGPSSTSFARMPLLAEQLRLFRH